MQRNQVYQKIKFYVLYLSWKSVIPKFILNCALILLPTVLPRCDADLLSPLPSLSFTILLCLFLLLCCVMIFPGARANFWECLVFSGLVNKI